VEQRIEDEGQRVVSQAGFTVSQPKKDWILLQLYYNCLIETENWINWRVEKDWESDWF
jgi:hypothetical protein